MVTCFVPLYFIWPVKLWTFIDNFLSYGTGFDFISKHLFFLGEFEHVNKVNYDEIHVLESGLVLIASSDEQRRKSCLVYTQNSAKQIK